MLTTGGLKKIKELAAEGLNDRHIAERLGVCKDTVMLWRHKMGVKAAGTYDSRQYYTIYDRNDRIRAHGSAKECAKALGIKVDSVYRMANRSKKNGDGRVIRNEDSQSVSKENCRHT